jgi:hypothetical protein
MLASFKELLTEIQLSLVANAFVHSVCFHQQLKKISIFERLEFHQSVFRSPLRNFEVSVNLFFILNRRQTFLRNRKSLSSKFTVGKQFVYLGFAWCRIQLDIVCGTVRAITITLQRSPPETRISTVCV